MVMMLFTVGSLASFRLRYPGLLIATLEPCMIYKVHDIKQDTKTEKQKENTKNKHLYKQIKKTKIHI